MVLHSRIEGEGLPLLIIHGFLGMSDNWKSIATQFTNDGFQVHSLDLRNHGKSFHSDVFNYDVMVNDVKEYIDFHQITNCVLLGHSMGGKVAMLFATTYPDIVSKLIVADIGPKYYAPHHQLILAGLNAVDFDLQTSRSEVEEILAHYIPDFGTRQFLMKNVYWQTPDQLAFRFNLPVLTTTIQVIGTDLPYERTFHKPTLFLRGATSDYILDSDLDLILHHFYAATLVTIDNAGHWLHAENPKDFYFKVLQFLK
ncbi:alpha/beta fold hydrolase [Flavobacterium sp.]|jgi:esterase|uniref:alpha/beta fold hydrolase n=1 Tax=Flavobacterium sp. TaxID=239 RepID=UPI0037C0EFB7